nr:DnaJ domain-containing protein [Lachnospiraceae bacterium]
MRKDYDILGIEENADKKTVKKAYFKLIREYTPEKNPERFQEIRAAYERLIEEMEHPANSIRLEFPADDMFAKSMFDQIQQLINEGDYSKALKTAEEGVRYYGEVECFLYMVAKCSILNDKTGKAVKAYEKLEERYPDKLLYKGELARAYYMRGYTNKAYNMFREAYAEGWREYEFLTDYSMCCGNREKFDEGIDVLKTYVNSLSQQEKKKNTAELMNAYIGMFTMSRTDTQEQEEIIQEIINFLEFAGDDVSEYEDMVSTLYMLVMMG